MQPAHSHRVCWKPAQNHMRANSFSETPETAGATNLKLQNLQSLQEVGGACGPSWWRVSKLLKSTFRWHSYLEILPKNATSLVGLINPILQTHTRKSSLSTGPVIPSTCNTSITTVIKTDDQSLNNEDGRKAVLHWIELHHKCDNHIVVLPLLVLKIIWYYDTTRHIAPNKLLKWGTQSESWWSTQQLMIHGLIAFMLELPRGFPGSCY